jgi:hypothetical protein
MSLIYSFSNPNSILNLAITGSHKNHTCMCILYVCASVCVYMYIVYTYVCVSQVLFCRISYSTCPHISGNSIRYRTQGLTLAKQALFHLSHSESPFWVVILDRGSCSMLGWAGPWSSYWCFLCTWDDRCPSPHPPIDWDDEV